MNKSESIIDVVERMRRSANLLECTISEIPGRTVPRIRIEERESRIAELRMFADEIEAVNSRSEWEANDGGK